MKDLEAYNGSEDFAQKAARPLKMYALLPQKKIRPLNININTTVLLALHKNLHNDVPLEGRDLWNYYFDTGRITKTERKVFEEFMVTDGLSASISVSRYSYFRIIFKLISCFTRYYSYIQKSVILFFPLFIFTKKAQTGC